MRLWFLLRFVRPAFAWATRLYLGCATLVSSSFRSFCFVGLHDFDFFLVSFVLLLSGLRDSLAFLVIFVSGVTFAGGVGSHLSGDEIGWLWVTGVAGAVATLPGTGGCACGAFRCSLLGLRDLGLFLVSFALLLVWAVRLWLVPRFICSAFVWSARLWFLPCLFRRSVDSPVAPLYVVSCVIRQRLSLLIGLQMFLVSVYFSF